MVVARTLLARLTMQLGVELRTVAVSECIHSPVGWEPRLVQLQSGNGVLYHTAVKA